MSRLSPNPPSAQLNRPAHLSFSRPSSYQYQATIQTANSRQDCHEWCWDSLTAAAISTNSSGPGDSATALSSISIICAAIKTMRVFVARLLCPEKARRQGQTARVCLTPEFKKGIFFRLVAKVAELAYALDLGSSSERNGGSSPPFRTA